jgi:hypothetical protein
MEFRFTIINDTVETVIDEPIGWDKCKFTLARDENYHGIFVTFSTDLEFVGTGYTIISDAFYDYGIEKILLLRIEERCNASYEYETMFTGRVNLSRFQDLFNGYCSCKVNLEDSNNSMLIKNNADKIINFSETIEIEGETLAPLEENVMTMHSKAIVLTTVFEDSIGLDGGIDMSLVDNTRIAMPFWLLEKSDDLNSAVTSENFFITRNTLSNPIWWQNIAQFKASYAGDYIVDYNIISQTSFTACRSFDMDIRVSIFKNGDPFLDLSPIINHSDGLIACQKYTDDWIINGSTTIPLVVNDYISIFYLIRWDFIPGGINTPNVYWEHYSSIQNVTFKSNTLSPETTAKTYLIHECFERIAQATINKQVAFESNFLGRKDIGYGANGCASFTALTNGFNIRDFDKPILTSLNDIFNSLSAVHCLGLGLIQKGDNEVIKVEPIDYFYDGDNQIAEMLNIKQITVASNESMIYNTALIGFEKYGTEEGTDKNNTLDGFATQHNYNLPITTVKKAFIKVCKYITDHYAIEFTRRQQLMTTSTQSWKFDDDNFMICTNRTEDENGFATSLNIAEKNENFTVTNNILSPETGYNLRLTPKRMLLKWNQLLSGAYAKMAGVSAKFANGISNYLYQSQLEGNCTDRYNNQLLSENQNLSWDDANNVINNPIIEPIGIKYSYPMTSQVFNNILANPGGYISCSKSSTIEHRGFIKMLTFTPTEGIAEMELIRMFGNESACDLIYVECPYVESEYVE